MKIIKLIITGIIVSMLFLMNNCTYASRADYTDEDAERDTQKLIQEHKENFDSSKSDNNFLKELTVKGIAITPSFDRQVVNYSANVDDNTKEIDIVASSEDSRATVKGVGKIDISNTSECRIEVIAESGTTRTYFIKIHRVNEKNENVNNTNKTTSNENNAGEIVNQVYNTVEENENSNNIKNNKKYILIGICIAIVFFIFIFFIKSKNKKSRH